MAKPPELIRDSDGEWKFAGSFSSGRYQFGLSPAGERLVRDELGYDEDETVPWNLFRTLVYAGDAWLPSAANEPVETGDDLVRPRSDVSMTDTEARAVADHLRGTHLDREQKEALEVCRAETKLGTFLDADESSRSATENRRSATTVLHVSDSYLKPGTESDVDGIRGLGGFATAMDVAIDEAVDAVVHTGNLYASATPNDEVKTACLERVERLHRRGIQFFVVAGRNEAGDTAALDAIAETADVSRLGTSPTMIDESVALYGIDHRHDMAERDGDIRLGKPDEQCLKLCCIHQAVSPPYSEYGADVEAYELAVERIDGWVDAFLCGGTDRAVEWESDELRVYYAGTTDHTRVREDEDEPLVNLFTVRGEEFERERISLDGYDGDARERNRGKKTEIGRGDVHSADEERAPELANAEIESILAATASLATTVDDAETPEFDGCSTADLADMYALFSAVQNDVKSLRTAVRDVLSTRVDEGERVSGSFGSVSGYRSTRKSLKDDEDVLSALSRYGVSRNAVVTERVDETKVEDVIEDETLDIDESLLYDISEKGYVRRNDIDRDALRRSFEE